MPRIAEVGLLLTLPGGHPVLVLSDYPRAPTDLVVMVNFTDAKLGPPLFGTGYALSPGFRFEKASTIFLDVREVTRAQAEAIVQQCSDRGFVSKRDVERVRSYVGQNAEKISSPAVRRLINLLAW